MAIILPIRKLFMHSRSQNHQIIKCNSYTFRMFLTFQEINAQRRAQAQRSLLVQVNSGSCFEELYGYCSKYATIKDIHCYTNSTGKNFMIVEFHSEGNLQHILQTCVSCENDHNVLPKNSQFLCYGELNKSSSFKKVKSSHNVDVQYRNSFINDETLNKQSKQGTLSDQIQFLYDKTKLSDTCTRLRYLVARQMEVTLGSIYSNIVVQPFGSSVNGFGKMGCDLDLVLTHESEDQTNKRLVYGEKVFGDLNLLNSHLELVANILEDRVLGVSHVQRVLHARVPILKFLHSMTSIDCDFLFNNRSGIYMSELLWMYGSLHPCVRPLTFAVRRWAKSRDITKSPSTTMLTNFSLTLLVLFFLQQDRFKGGPILPSINALSKKAGKEKNNLKNRFDYTFLCDIKNYPQFTNRCTEENLGTLLLQFFEFYSQFDFKNQAICVSKGIPIAKPSRSPLYIVNPLEKSLNVSRNVSMLGCRKLVYNMKFASENLTSLLEDNDSEVGLVELLHNNFHVTSKAVSGK